MKRCAAFGLALCFCVILFSPATAISDAQKTAIVEKCSLIKDNLKNVQRLDARTRIFLGSHYEIILSKFITPLNLRLVENNISDIDLIENQNKFSMAKMNFTADYISYQQSLEELVVMNCKDEPEKFYEKLTNVREGRKKMIADVQKLKELVLTNLRLVNNFLERVK